MTIASRSSLRVVVAGLAMALLVASAATAQYLPREEWQSDYRNWQQQTGQRYDTWRSTEPRSTSGDIRDLIDGNVRPGQYNVQLPLGLKLRVNVRDGGADYQQRPSQLAHELASVAAQLRSDLQQLRYLLAQGGFMNTVRDVDDAMRELAAAMDLARRNRPVDEVAARIAEYDRVWHRLEERLVATTLAGPRAQQAVRNVRDGDAHLHRLIDLRPTQGYDRLEVFAIVQRLEQRLGIVRDTLEREARGYGYRQLVRDIDDAHDQARDLLEAVQQDEPYASVAQEFAQFDRAWHTVAESTTYDEAVARRQWETSREIHALDARLHELLELDAPMSRHRGDLDTRLDSLARYTEQLYRMLRHRGGQIDDDLVDEAQDVYRAVRNAQQRIGDGRRNRGERRELLREIVEQWHDFEHRLEDLRGDPRTRAMIEAYARQVDVQMRALPQYGS